MRIAVSGATGLVGSALVPFLAGDGHRVIRLVRSTPTSEADDVFWDTETGRFDASALDGFDAVVHLAGENIAAGRWTARRRNRIRDSRVRVTRLLCEALTRLRNPPTILACASAIGYYGDRGDELLREDSPPGEGFLSELCRAWEDAAEPARQAGLRVVHLRFGVILSPTGGALARMLGPFRKGLGARLGHGRQYMSWVTLDDAIDVVAHALRTRDLHGPLNVVSPQSVTNRAFTKTLGRVLRRPAVIPAPAFALRLALGAMADELLLAGTRVEPSRLLTTGYTFRHPRLEPALRYLLGR